MGRARAGNIVVYFYLSKTSTRPTVNSSFTAAVVTGVVCKAQRQVDHSTADEKEDLFEC